MGEEREIRLASEAGLCRCDKCGTLNRASETNTCSVCGSEFSPRKARSLQHSVAWLLVAIILYVPANAFPMMVIGNLGKSSSSTILGGVIELLRYKSYLVAGIIFVASVIVPLAKILSLSWLCWISSYGYRSSHPGHTRLYEITEVIGRWSMIDVCVVAVMVSLVQLGGLLRIDAGPAGIAFSGVVVATMLAARSFDPRLIWDAIRKRQREELANA